MKGLIWFLVVACCAVALALLAHVSEGYVLVVTPPYRTEISLALFVLLVVAGFALVYSVLRLAIHTLRLPAYVAEFRTRQRAVRGIEVLRRAWRSYFEGRFGQAHQLAAKAFQLGESPALAALLAARAAHFMRDPERRDLWLTRAANASDDDRSARMASQAELLLDDRRFAEAADVLTELHAGGPRHVWTLRMLLRAQQGLRNWEEVLRLARQLQKRGALATERARQAMVTAVVETIRHKSADGDQLHSFWRSVEDDLRADPGPAAAVARAFIALGNGAAATAAVRHALDRHWDEELIGLWAECADSPASQRLDQAERWLEGHPHDAVLLATLGRLCVERALWGKAQSYLEASLSAQPTRGAHVALARLFDRLERREEANRHYRAAAALAEG